MTPEQQLNQPDVKHFDNSTLFGAGSETIARTWRLRSLSLSFHDGPALMGIVNVTPDSFSDGGRFYSPQSAIDHALRLEDSGATILDIGGESTRPYSQPVAEDEELRRVVPVLEGLSNRVSVPLSIDTTKSKVAQAAIELGAEIVNDVSGLEKDPLMVETIANSGVGVCLMHSQGSPLTMQDNPSYQDVVKEIFEYLQARDRWLQSLNIQPERICLDPGIGFGKTHQHNLTLLRNAAEFLKLGRPVLIGHSRKGFIGKLVGDKERDRDAGSLGISIAMALKGIQVIRVHDVLGTRDALTCLRACLELGNFLQ